MLRACHNNTEDIGNKSEHCYHNALISTIKAHAACKDTVLAVSRLTAHNVRVALFKAESKCREAVCDKIYPQQMNRLKQSETAKSCKENRKYFRKI